MDLSYLEKLVKLFEESTLTELEIDEEGAQVRLSRQKEVQPMQVSYAPPPNYGVPAYGGGQPMGGGEAHAPKPAESKGAAESSQKLHEVKSPIVGTFYRSPAPDADPYVQVGQHVESGTTVCIIEAMKLMNEIESDMSGKIVKILIENGQPVEYGQVLMLIE